MKMGGAEVTSQPGPGIFPNGQQNATNKSSSKDISQLKPGDHHYMAYVGPPEQYDFMGATQFRLLTTLGLRADHSLLDFGCGSLRAGRLFLGYLNEGHYFGIDPNKWLIEEAIDKEVGKDFVALKGPHFNHNSDFRTDVFSQQFDFILAQSIFSHAGIDLIGIALRNFHESLKPDGLVVATFIEGISDFDRNGWIYPGCVSYRPSTIGRFAEEASFSIIRLPWYHPRQTWYALSRESHRLPNKAMMRHLSGAVLFDAEFVDSWRRSQTVMGSISNYIKQFFSQPIQ
jgi:SAM-dependent methyltransferase